VGDSHHLCLFTINSPAFFIGPKDTKKYGIRGYHLAPFREQGDVPTPLFSSVLQ
jgi:hypothetical protein